MAKKVFSAYTPPPPIDQTKVADLCCDCGKHHQWVALMHNDESYCIDCFYRKFPELDKSAFWARQEPLFPDMETKIYD